jgi:AGZA family xanthine/uracil permease-like MFS transporter
MGVGSRLAGWPTVVFAFGLILAIILLTRRVKGALLLTIIVTTIFAIVVNAIADVPASFVPGADGAPPTITPTGWQLNVPEFAGDVFSAPDFGLLGEFSLGGSFAKVGVISALLFVFTLMLSDFFDTMGTIVGVGAEGDLLDADGRLPGVGEGARTGLANLVTGGLFLLALFIAPLVKVVPYEAASPVLVVVGFLMMTQVRHIDWDDYDIAIPAFLTMVLMPFTYSITNGIGAGFIAYVVIKLARGRARDVHPFLYVVAALFVVYFAIDPVERLLGVK